MEVLGICYIDGVPLEICKFSVEYVSYSDSEESNQEQFQRQMVERWREIFKQQERRDEDWSTVLYASHDCRVQSSTVGSLWRRCAFVLLPKEPLTVGPAANQQRLLAVTVGKERLSPEEVADRVRATYGSTALLQSQKLQRCGGGLDSSAKIGRGAFFFVLEEDTPDDAAGVEEEVGHSKVCKDEKQDATSALLVSRDPFTGPLHGLPAHIISRYNPKAIGTAEIPRSTLPVGSAVPKEPQLGYAGTLAQYLQQMFHHPKEVTPEKGTCVPVGGAQLMSRDHMKSLFPLWTTMPPVSLAMSSAVGVTTSEDRTSDPKPCPLPRPPTTLSFRNVFEKEAIHAIEHKYNGPGAPCVLKAQQEECTEEMAVQAVKGRYSLVNHEMFQCFSPTCTTCPVIRRLGEKHSQFCELCDCKVPHCEIIKKKSTALSTYAVKRETFPAKEESQDGHTTHHSRTLQQRAPSNLPHTSEVLPLPIQDIAPPTAPPTALPTTPPPTKPPSSVVTLKESIALVIAYQSLKEKPKGYLPTGGMIENKYLNNFCFGYSVMPDVFTVNQPEPHKNQERGATLGKGGNGQVYKAHYRGRVFAVKETKYRPDEILKWKKMCHPNLVPLLALQCSFSPVEPVELGSVTATCWAYMPVMDIDLRNVLNNMEPLVDRMSAARPFEVDVMMSNVKHILRETLKGLEALHNMGLVHRDIKEHNVLLRSQCSCPDYFTCVCPRGNKCEVAIIDFDSIVENGAGHSLKRIPGTYGYRAPEVYSRTYISVSPSPDVWAFGVIATHVFLGRNREEQEQDAAKLLDTNARQKHHRAEVVVPQLKLKDLLCHRVGELHEAAMFVKECLEVDASRRKTASALLKLPFLSH